MKLEPTEREVDRGLEVLAVAKAAARGLDLLNGGVQPLETVTDPAESCRFPVPRRPMLLRGVAGSGRWRESISTRSWNAKT